MSQTYAAAPHRQLSAVKSTEPRELADSLWSCTPLKKKGEEEEGWTMATGTRRDGEKGHWGLRRNLLSSLICEMGGDREEGIGLCHKST